MIAKLNPFPVYPVVRLQEEEKKIQESTIITPAIEKSHTFIQQYCESWNNKSNERNQNVESLIVAIRGDYGTGKTHLLVDAISQIKQALAHNYSNLFIIKTSGIETDVINWFKITIFPELKRLSLSDIIVLFYAKAGQAVAAETRLTEAAVGGLENNPFAIHELLQENLLNITAVEQKFQELLDRVCHDANEEVRKVLAGLVWAETATLATRWLAGKELDPMELDRLKISKNLTTSNDANGVLIAIAAIHNYLNRPFIFMIDELEHLTRYDEVNRSRQNITWLKRLIENLANYQTFIYVAGHWDAWDVQSDFLDRFHQDKSIELHKLSADDVLKIVQARVDNLSSDFFGYSQAEAIVEKSRGNIRTTLSFCHNLFQVSEGFNQPITPEIIDEVASQIGRHISIDEATLYVHEILEQKGLNIRYQDEILGIKFDLIGYSENRPKALIDLRQTSTNTDFQESGRLFLEKIRKIVEEDSAIIGCFVADGYIDKEWLKIAQTGNQLPILWFDLSEPNVLPKIKTALGDYLQGNLQIDHEISVALNKVIAKKERITEQIEAGEYTDNAERRQLEKQRQLFEQQIADLQKQLSVRDDELEQELRKIEQRRLEEMQKINERITAIYEQSESSRDRSIIQPVIDEELQTKFHQIYSELTKSPSLITKINYVITGKPLAESFISLLFTFFGISIIINTYSLAYLLVSMSFGMTSCDEISYVYEKNSCTIIRELLIILILLTGLFFVLMGILKLWNRLNETERFFKNSNRMLREIYVRSVNPEDLIRVDNILRDCLDEYGPVEGKSRSRKRLAKAFPEIFSYLDAENLSVSLKTPPSQEENKK